MAVKIKELTASDFPGIDEAKFNEWKALKIKKNRERRIAFYIGVGILLILSVVSVLTARPIFLSIFVILLIIDDLIFFIAEDTGTCANLGMNSRCPTGYWPRRRAERLLSSLMGTQRSALSRAFKEATK
jgi:hypothetical protein